MRLAAAHLHLRDNRAHRDRRALLYQDARKRPRSRRRDLHVHLVGYNLDEGVVLLDRIADLLQPPADDSLCYRLPNVGQLYLHLWAVLMPCMPSQRLDQVSPVHPVAVQEYVGYVGEGANVAGWVALDDQ